MTAPHTLLKAWDLRARKALGQNFLENPATADKIAETAAAGPDDVVVEIGAGLGALTVPLARRAGRVIAIETDRRLIDLLRAELLAHRLANVTVAPADVLSVDLAQWRPSDGGRLIVVGNLPYNISSQIIVRLIAARRNVDRAVIMIQKELADRLTSAPGNKAYGRLTVMLAYCAVVRHAFTIGAAQFHPRPKVDSSVIEIRFADPVPHPAADEAVLFRVIKAAFGQRRKTLRNALKGGLPMVAAGGITAALAASRVDPGRRAETLSVGEFVGLADAMAEYLDDAPLR